jgi:hypothetical protein
VVYGAENLFNGHVVGFEKLSNSRVNCLECLQRLCDVIDWNNIWRLSGPPQSLLPSELQFCLNCPTGWRLASRQPSAHLESEFPAMHSPCVSANWFPTRGWIAALLAQYLAVLGLWSSLHPRVSMLRRLSEAMGTRQLVRWDGINGAGISEVEVERVGRV